MIHNPRPDKYVMSENEIIYFRIVSKSALFFFVDVFTVSQLPHFYCSLPQFIKSEMNDIYQKKKK